MKRKIKNSLSPLQQKRLLRVSLVILLIALLWLLFAPDMGVVHLQRENTRLDSLQQQKSQLEQENAALREEIERIQKDIEYFERMAREKHGLLKKNEMVFDFNKEKEPESPEKK